MLGQTVDEKIKIVVVEKRKKVIGHFCQIAIRLVVYHKNFFNNDQFRHIGKIELN